ncbi:AMP deaminase, partial [Coemansia sp. RSA 552]
MPLDSRSDSEPLTRASGSSSPSPDETRDAEHHPYLTRRTMSKSTFAAEQAFVNSMFDQESGATPFRDSEEPVPSSAASDIAMTPRSILMSQRLGQVHADAVLPQLSPLTPAATVDLRTMPPLTLEEPMSSTLTAGSAGRTPASPFSTDDDAVGRRLEKELRTMMARTHIDGQNEDELAGMMETPAELQRIGTALTRCMRLRTKYMGMSLQREGDNPRNKKDWKVYPPPPPPAWRNYNEPASSEAVEFDMKECEVPGPDACSFSLGDDGL